MSKKHKSNRKHVRKPATKKPATKVAAPATLKKKTNGRERPATAATGVHPRVVPASAPAVQPAAVADDHRGLPFWARMPLAIADFWFSRREPRAR
ncbi:MAG: hypothetical protein QOG38_165 [Hyphomicrobiales bacterium]|jgi:hypothetical protein|nr:hypothetical protein [Hyphomicrobiales bacterium]